MVVAGRKALDLRGGFGEAEADVADTGLKADRVFVAVPAVPISGRCMSVENCAVAAHYCLAFHKVKS